MSVVGSGEVDVGTQAGLVISAEQEPSALVAVVKFFIQFVVPELCFTVRLPVNHYFVVELTLYLAIEYLQFVVRNPGKILREGVLGSKVQLIDH